MIGWPAILRDGRPQQRWACHACDRGPHDKALSVTLKPGGVWLAHCHRCGFAERHDPLHGRAHPMPLRPARSTPGPRSQREGLAPWAASLWASCGPVAGEALAYLDARGCVIPPADGDLRWHPRLRHPSGYEGPALVGLVTHACTREPLTLHRTWIKAGGAKADVDPPRLLLAGHSKREGVIRLWPDEAVTLGLLVAEGVETALAAARDYAPAWACVDAGNLAALPVLAGVETLVIGADHDDAGLRAATACADRWAQSGVGVHVVTPRAAKSDWADARAAA